MEQRRRRLVRQPQITLRDNREKIVKKDIKKELKKIIEESETYKENTKRK